MIRYLADSTAIWRMTREPRLGAAWGHDVDQGAIGSCHPQRTEFRGSARDLIEYDQMTDTFADLYPDVKVPKTAWQWIEAAQYRLARLGQHRSLSVVDWLICATAAHHGLVVLHDDKDFTAAARVLTDVVEHNVRHIQQD